MKAAAWRTQRKASKNEMDRDMLRALAQLPPDLLNNVDDVFALLNSGLGASVSACMSRREAQKIKQSAGSLSPRKPMTQLQKIALFMNPSLSALAAKRRSRPVNALKQATQKLKADKKQVVAQNAVLLLMKELSGQARSNTFFKGLGQEIHDAFAEQEEEDDELPGDDELLEWAQAWLKMTPERRKKSGLPSHLQEKVLYQLQCWEATRSSTSLIPLPAVPQPAAPKRKAWTSKQGRSGSRMGSRGRLGRATSKTSCSNRPMSKEGCSSRPLSKEGRSSRPTSKEGRSSRPVSKEGQPSRPLSKDGRSSRPTSKDGRSSRPTSKGGSNSVSNSRPNSRGFQTSSFGNSQQGSRNLRATASPNIQLLQRRVGLPSLGAAGPDKKPLDLVAPPQQALGPSSSLDGTLPELVPWVPMAARAMSEKGRPRPAGLRPSRVFRVIQLPAVAKCGSKQLLRRAQPPQPEAKTELAETPEFFYMRACELARMVPRPEALQHFHKGVVDASRIALSDDDAVLLVKIAVQNAAAGHVFKELNLSYNRLTDHGLQTISSLLRFGDVPSAGNTGQRSDDADQLVSCCAQLENISLAGNTALKFRVPGLADALGHAFSSLPSLAVLDFAGLQLNGRPILSLTQILSQRCLALRSVSFAGCGLGLTDQSDCVAVAALLTSIEHADFSGNFFNLAGYVATSQSVQRSTKLKSLSFAGNTARGSNGLPVAHNNFSAGSEQLGSKTSSNPLQVLVEALQLNRHLDMLDISNCSIGPDTAFILEEVLMNHPTLSQLCLDDNPLGEAGVRCAIRLLLYKEPQFSKVSLSGHREDWTEFTHIWSPTQPSGNYRLNLQLPIDRSVLRSLLRANEVTEAHMETPSARYLRFESKSPKPLAEKDQETGQWIVHSFGPCSVSFLPPISSACFQRRKWFKQTDTRETSSSKATADSINVRQSEGQMQAGGEATTKQSRSFFGVPARATNRKESHDSVPRSEHLQEEGDDTPRIPAWWPQRIEQVPPGQHGTLEGDWSELADLIVQARHPVSQMGFQLLMKCFRTFVTEPEQRRFLLALCRDFSLNCAQAMQLCSNADEVTPNPDLLSLVFPCLEDRRSQFTLISLISYSHSQMLKKQVETCLWFVEGNLTGHYLLDLSAPSNYHIAENCFLASSWEAEVAKSAGRPDLSPSGNYETIRNQIYNELPFSNTRDWKIRTSGWLSFDYSSTRRPPPDVTPMPEVAEVIKQLQRSQVTTQQKLHALRAVSVHMYLSTRQCQALLHGFTSKLQEGQILQKESRDVQDAFCILHTRVTDRNYLLGPELLHASANAEEFSNSPSIKHHPSAFVQSTEEQHEDGYSAAAIARWRQSQLSPLSQGDRKALARRLGILHLVNPLRPELVRIECNLAVRDHRKFMEFLLHLAPLEAGGHAVGWDIDGTKQIVLPLTWMDYGPPVDGGEFLVSYASWSANMPVRYAVAEQYTVGFYGVGLGEKPPDLIPVKEIGKKAKQSQ
eukprot:TRINITY_DN5802_c0_g1_i1.p1 TRINITY_DN5802_c0_g1~~TRINITY_DN5802_c0_g1_i1.p1  ORF type:complete len:1484 (+),score=279.34 TRINITY_DN5802_c0_g1_i1:161-4612(+)